MLLTDVQGSQEAGRGSRGEQNMGGLVLQGGDSVALNLFSLFLVAAKPTTLAETNSFFLLLLSS